MKKLFIIILILFQTQLAWATVRSFDGTDDKVGMGSVLDVDGVDVSLCSWVKLTEDASTDAMGGKKSNDAFSSAGIMLYQSGAADVARIQVADAVDGVESSTIAQMDDGAWHWVCGTWNNSTDTTIIYEAGVQDDTDTNTLIGATSNAVNYVVGEYGGGSGDASGLIAYHMQFQEILTAIRVNDLMWRPDLSYGAGGFWPMYGGDSPEQDLSGNNRDGTVTGAITSTDGPPIMIGDAPS